VERSLGLSVICGGYSAGECLLLVLGGVLYSLGIVFHAWEGLKFQNAIWHGFVLLAAICHYFAVLLGAALR
jgi:hemolysin III